MRMQQQQAKPKANIPWKTVLLVVSIVVLTVFAVQNWTPVPVWPINTQKPLTLVIALSFGIGALIGWLAHSILFGRRTLAPDRNVIDEDDR